MNPVRRISSCPFPRKTCGVLEQQILSTPKGFLPSIARYLPIRRSFPFRAMCGRRDRKRNGQLHFQSQRESGEVKTSATALANGETTVFQVFFEPRCGICRDWTARPADYITGYYGFTIHLLLKESAFLPNSQIPHFVKASNFATASAVTLSEN
jgi:hypothetical protein